MTRKHHVLLLTLPVALIAAADQPWKDKQIAQWTEEDAKQVLTESPWARQVTPIVNPEGGAQRGSRGGRGGGMGRGGIGLGIPGVGIGMGGPGMGRRGGGYPGGGYPQDGRYPQDDRYPQDTDRYPQGNGGSQGEGSDRGGQNSDYNTPPTLTLRWESALPVQEAQLKSKTEDSHSVDASHYVIAVIGLPARLARNPKMSEKTLKGEAELKRDGKKLAKPSDVRVISRDDGLTVLYLFPRSKEISSKDTRIDFDAHLGRYEIREPFHPNEMIYAGKLEL